jgi:molybdate transport system regulatory protein
MKTAPQIRLRFALKGDVAMGPGKADLLAHVAETGSITAAAKKMNMSYRRAWLLIAELNDCFKTPIVETAKGGRGGGGGASLTPLGVDLLKRYHAMVAKTERSIASDFKALANRLA